jgi:hypothetical protein
MKRIMPIFAPSLLVIAAAAMYAQAPPPVDRGANTRARAEAKATDSDVTYGSVKEFTTGQKIVIDVDNAVDKTFDLNDKDLKVKLYKGLKVGDHVKVTEHEVLGKTKSVAIAKHTGGGVAHGDKDPAAKKP